MLEVRSMQPAPSAVSNICGIDSDVNTMLSIFRTRLCRNLSVAREVVDVEAVSSLVLSTFSSSVRCVDLHAERKMQANTRSMTMVSFLYSSVALKEGQALAAKSRCPCIVA